MVRRVDGARRFGDAREARGAARVRDARRRDVVKVAVAVPHHFVADAKSATAAARIRMEQQAQRRGSRLEIIVI